jgi:hypothetical protein
VNNANGEKDVTLAIALALAGQIPNTFTGYAAAVQREGNNLSLFLDRFTNGNDVETEETPITSIQGNLILEYDRSSDRLTARIGSTSLHFDGVWALHGAAHGDEPMIIAIGCVTSDGNITFPGTRVYLDNFTFTGVKKARP